MKIIHKRLEIEAEFKDNFTQNDLENYQEQLLELAKDKKSSAAMERIMIEAALHAKILSGVSKPGEMKPSAVKFLTQKINQLINKAVEIPPQ